MLNNKGQYFRLMDKETAKQAKRVVTCITFMLEAFFSSFDNATVLVSPAGTALGSQTDMDCFFPHTSNI